MRGTATVVFFCVSSACASAELQRKVDDQANRILVLQRHLAVLQTRVDELNNYVVILEAKRPVAQMPPLAMSKSPLPTETADDRLTNAQKRLVGGAGHGEPGRFVSGVAAVAAQKRNTARVDDEALQSSLAVTKLKRRIIIDTKDEPTTPPSKTPSLDAPTSSNGESAATAATPLSSDPTLPCATRTRNGDCAATEAADARDAPSPAVTKPAARASSKRIPTDSSTNRAYSAARRLFAAKRYIDAVAAFDDIAKQSPDHPLAENSIFWIGAAYFERGEFSLALSEYERLLSRFSGGRKSADAIYRAGLCHVRLKEFDRARERFRSVLERFPKSEVARDARLALSSLEKEKK